MKRYVYLLLCFALLVGVAVIPASADFTVTHYYEEIYAGGVMDMAVFVGEADLTGYTFQWQFGFMGDDNWIDLEDNESYQGTKTNRMKVYTAAGGNYDGWEEIAFRCRVTKDGVTKSSKTLHMYIHPTEQLETDLRSWGFGLYEPNVKNATALYTKDDKVYTANAFAGAKLDIFCGGNTETQRDILVNSEVELRREICITENGKTVVSGDRTVYVPYTVGLNAVTVQINMRIILNGEDRGIYDSKTVNISTVKPEVIGIGTAKSACSMLRYTYNESEKLASFAKGDTVEVIGEEGSYYLVYSNNQVGYIGKSLLTVDTSGLDRVIRDVDVTIDPPMAGRTPAQTCNILTEGCTLYPNEPITWIDVETGKFMDAEDEFQEGKSYKVNIWIEAETGYTFQVNASTDPDVGGIINGNLPAFVYTAYEQDPRKVIDLTFTFVNTPAAPDYLVGDMNTDGVVTDADAIYLLRFVLFPNNYPIIQPGDMNGDGEVTDADAIYLLRHTLFPDSYPLK